jgi:hypothetical protein
VIGVGSAGRGEGNPPPVERQLAAMLGVKAPAVDDLGVVVDIRQRRGGVDDHH